MAVCVLRLWTKSSVYHILFILRTLSLRWHSRQFGHMHIWEVRGTILEVWVHRPRIQKFVAVARAIGEHVGQADSLNILVCWGCTSSFGSISS